MIHLILEIHLNTHLPNETTDYSCLSNGLTYQPNS